MDETIKNLLLEATSRDDSKEKLFDAYAKLKRSQESTDQPNAFAADIFVICAETALKYAQLSIAEDCLKMYFQKAASGNDYLGRAYICQAHLNKPSSGKFPDQLEKCAVFILKAINFGKQNKRHHYLVYNGSVLYWSFARPFVRPNIQHCLTKTLHQIVKALDDIDDKDYEWRLQLMISLIECYLDGGKKEDASHVSTAAASFAKAYCPHMYKMILALQVQNKLIDQSKLLKESKLSNDVVIYFKILKLKSQVESAEKVDIDLEVDKLYRAICTDGVETPGTGRSTRMGQVSSTGPISQTEKVPLLIDLARLCIECQKAQHAEECLGVTVGKVKDDSMKLEIDFLKTEVATLKLKETNNVYTKANVEKRKAEIEYHEDNLFSAIRLKVPSLIQHGCVTMWNLCLPLLQKGLRKIVKGPLKIIAEALEDIDSLLIAMRCQIHIEIAKCEEENEQLEYAMTHLNKALLLDDNGLYKNRIEAALRRLELRSMLYQTPDRPEDIAALIIEQARSTKEAGTLQMKRASLIEAGLTLAPDAFNLVMDGEAGLVQSRGVPSNPKLLGDKVAKYHNSMNKVSGHLKRIQNASDKERVQIWADLAKTARKQRVWDVTRVAAKFCLMYDDGRWEATKREVSAKEEHRSSPLTAANGNVSHEAETKKTNPPKGEQLTDEFKDLLGIIAEIHFIYSEALVQLLQAEGVNLLESPVPIEDNSFKPKSREGTEVKAQDTTDWKIYSDWIESISTEAISGFHRGAKLGADMNAPWFICNAGIYIWNYTNHLLAAGNFLALTKVYRPLYDDMKSIGYSEDVTFFCTFAHALARGYMQNHLPDFRQTSPVPAPEKEKKWRAGKQSDSPTHSRSKAYVVTNDLEALGELKQALEILEHALSLTSVAESRHLVPISTRHPLIKSWVLCKMLTGQPLPKNLGHDDESAESQGPMSKALCAVEALALQQKYSCDITNCPGLFEAIKLVENCKWDDRLVEIEMWTRLSFLASKGSFCQIVLQCGEKALELAKKRKSINYEKLNDVMKHKFKVEQELLYYTSVLMGENLVGMMHGRSEVRHQALNHFFEACRFATKARNYTLAMSAVRHYWSTVQPIISTSIERELLKEPIKALLKCIADAWKHSEFKELHDKKDDGETDGKKVQKASSTKSSPGRKQKEKGKSSHGSKKSAASGSRVQIGEEDVLGEVEGEPSSMDADLTLRAALYGLLFQAYADSGDWANGLKSMDEAVKVMPKTHHRLLIFKHRVIMNARLGNPVQFDMGKFKDSDERLLSSMWHRVARNSQQPKDQLSAYQNSIECLQSPGSEWQKVDYLADFANWLFVNEFPLADCLDHLESAMDIVMDVIKSKNALVPISARQSDKSFKMRGDPDIKTMISDCVDMQSLETLARLYVMSAKMQEGFVQKSKESILTAAYCIQKLWQSSIRIAEKSMRDGVKPGERPFSKAESKKKDTSKVDRVSSKTCVPNTLEQWAAFTLPEKLKEYFKNDVSGNFISGKSILKPELTYHFMDILTDSLCQHGYHPLCIPVSALKCYLATEILEDKFLINFSKLQLLDLLNEMELITASCNLSKSFGPPYITEEDKAESREQILIWKEKEAQVHAEESKHSMKTHAGTTNTKAKGQGYQVRHSNRLIEGFTRREIWTRTAKLLIKQGQYNDARELLEEARRSAEAFKDEFCLLQIEFNSAVLAYNECDWGTSISHLDRIQNLGGSLDFLCRVVSLKVDAYYRSLAIPTTFQCHPEIASSDKAIDVLASTIHLIDDLGKKSPNKFCQGIRVTAVLKAKLAQYLLKTSDVTKENKRQKIYQLLDESLQSFTSLGYSREVLQIIKTQCSLMQSTIASVSEEERRAALIRCFKVMKKAVDIAKKSESCVKQTAFEIGHACLPVEVEYAEAALCAMNIAVSILSEVSAGLQRCEAAQGRKASMVKILEDFVSVTPVFTDRQKDWNNATRSIGEEALCILTHIFNHHDKIPATQAKAAFLIGKCLHQLALQKFPGLEEYDQTFQLGSEKISVTTMAVDGKCDDEKAEDDTQEDVALSSMDARKREKALRIKNNYAEYTMFMTQAVEFLTQACQLGLRNGCKELIAQASYSLVKCIGNRDVGASLHFLALYQSATTAITLSETARRVFADPHRSRQAGLTQQRKNLTDMTSNYNDALGVRGLNLEMLQTESEAWRRLHVSRNHVDIIKEIPFPVTFVILQHSPDKSLLYAGLLEKPRQGLQTGKKKDQSVGVATRSYIWTSTVSQELLSELVTMSEQFKNDVSSFLLHKRYFEQQMQKRKEMLGLIERSSKSVSKEALHLQAQLADEEKQLQARFDDMIAALEAYCGSILPQLNESLMQEPTVERLVILADKDLLKLPLEALPVFANSDIKSISRDFSLQMFHHRITQGELAEQQNCNGERGKVAKKEKVDNKSKSDKTIANNRKVKGAKELVFGKDGIHLDLSNLRYIVDPTCEWPSEGQDAPSMVMTDLVLQLKNKAAKWTCLKGHDRVPSVVEMQKFIHESQSWIFYGSERLLAHIPPHLLAPVSLNDCHLILLLDNMGTIGSALRQARLDAQKSPADVALERPIDTAILLSLCGAPCLVLNQWQCETHSNKQRLHHLFIGVCEKSITVGQALQFSRCSKSTFQPVSQEEEDSVSGKANSSQGRRRTLQQRNSRAESARSNNLSSAGSQKRREKGTKLKGDAALDDGCEAGDGVLTEPPSQLPSAFELYNSVLYGLPNFTTTLQTGGS